MSPYYVLSVRFHSIHPLELCLREIHRIPQVILPNSPKERKPTLQHKPTNISCSQDTMEDTKKCKTWPLSQEV